MITKTVPEPATIERMLDEVEECAAEFTAFRCKLRQHGTGSAAYHDLLPELSVRLDVLRVKAKNASQTLEQHEDSLPDDT